MVKITKILMVMVTIMLLGLGFFNTSFAQTQRNPVLEFCTGTW
ncbi:MAG: hypothetical protein Kow0042_26990 [Calditrichia bacterium]